MRISIENVNTTSDKNLHIIFVLDIILAVLICSKYLRIILGLIFNVSEMKSSFSKSQLGWARNFTLYCEFLPIKYK